jgi:hypothetical protein
VHARLIVRRVKRLNPATVPAGQAELFAVHRHHAVFTDNPMPLLDAEAAHRGHAIIEQTIADLKNGPLAHLPCGKFNANAAWLALAAIAFNLTRAAGCQASPWHARATTATIRRQLISVPARLAHSARGSPCTCPPTGPGPSTGSNSSTPCGHHHWRPDRHPPPHRPSRRTERGRAGQTGRTATPKHTRPGKKINKIFRNDHTGFTRWIQAERPYCRSCGQPRRAARVLDLAAKVIPVMQSFETTARSC